MVFSKISCAAAAAAVFGLLEPVLAVNGSTSPNDVTTYQALPKLSYPGGNAKYPLKSGSYQYTGFGSAESNINFASNGSYLYSPALTNEGTGYAISDDKGETWRQILPGGPTGNQSRLQPVLRVEQDRQFFWSSSGPGLRFQYSDDDGNTFSAPLNNSHFFPLIQDWAKLISGPPVHSKLSPGVEGIMYIAAPSLISTPVPVQPLGPLNQLIMKSTDKGSTWQQTKGAPTLQPALSGGGCSGIFNNLADQELIIWGDGLVMPNGTVVYGLRRCKKLSLAISDDEGDSWRLVDVPESNLVTFFPGDLTYLFDGNTLVPEPLSMDSDGTLYAIWVDAQYALQMAKTKDLGATWSKAVVIAAPNDVDTLSTYLPTLVQHPDTVGRAALTYYGSTDKGKTWNGYIAETGNLNEDYPVFSSVIANPPDSPLQANKLGAWDQGYGDPLYDLVEFTDIKYIPGNPNGDFVAALTRRMCTAISTVPQLFDRSSCGGGWDYDAHGQSAWQGIILTGHH